MSVLPPIRATSPIADVGYPGTIMPALFLSGCDFRCPYCLNHQLVFERELDELDAMRILSEYMLSGERWIMISGGEPLRDARCVALLEEAAKLHLRVALATNGCYPGRLQHVVEERLAEHIVMDVKTAFDPPRYAEASGADVKWFPKVKESFDFLVRSDVEADFRITCCSKFVSRADVMSVAEAVGMSGILVLQLYRSDNPMDPDMANPELAVPYDMLQEWACAADPLVWKALVREV